MAEKGTDMHPFTNGDKVWNKEMLQSLGMTKYHIPTIFFTPSLMKYQYFEHEITTRAPYLQEH